jgi:hypothetical protein
MGLLFADINGNAVVRARLTIPFTGIWHADVLLAKALDVSGPQVLTIDGQPYNGTVIRAIDFAGARGVRLVGGMGGWRKQVSAKQYSNPIGVLLSTVLLDVALSVGEVVAIATDGPIGKTAYFRTADAASRVLDDTLGDAWWMDPLGIVQTLPRPTLPILSPFVATEVRGASGIYEIATEVSSDWTPGRAFLGPTVSGTISRVAHVLEKGSFRTEVMAA